MSDQDWWRGAVIYQIYPRSYMDTDGDGVGDLPGITKKLDYIASLGVDAIWISPFFQSPMKDYGYDVSDYNKVDPIFGTNEDFEKLLDEAHKRGIKIIVDMVLSHTSDQHEWFKESRKSRDNPKSDWYVWADPKPDGSAPNNWQSFFGGPSWRYETRRGQYYLHNFVPEQPDLNLWNPDVQDALLEAMRYWLERGVDGIRLDAIMCYFHSQGLEDNPPAADPQPIASNVDFPTPHSMQKHIHDHVTAPGVEFSKRIRALLDEYDARMAVAEVGGDDGIGLAIDYTGSPDKLQTAYNFNLLAHDPLTPDFIRRNISDFEERGTGSWPSWAFSNHDVVRPTTRWGHEEHERNPAYAQMLIALLLGLRCTAFMYQGEELGLPEAHIAYEQIQDPWGKYLYPEWQGRDGCRTPMVWDDMEPHAGFSSGESTWLPLDPRHPPLAVSHQDQDPHSTLNMTRALIKWRKQHPAMIKGSINFTDPAVLDKTVLSFVRAYDGQKILCVYNMGDAAQTITIQADAPPKSGGVTLGSNENLKIENGNLALPAFGFAFIELE